MKRKSLNLGVSRSTDDIDKVINALSSTIPSSAPLEANSAQNDSAEAGKIRVTHYLSTENLSAIEEVYDELRRRLPYNEKSKVKKSHIVDLALQLIVEDYHKKGDKSELVRHFIK